MSNDRSRIRDEYVRQLGRPASDDELDSWLSGAYGWGREGNIDPILQAIGQSGEAEAYRARQNTPTQQAVLGTMAGRDQVARGTVGTMRGFEQGDYGGDVKARTSVKNMFGRIAQRYQHAPNSIDLILNDPDFKQLFPNAKRVPGGAGDKIDFGGVLSDFETGTPVGIVDVLEASDPSRNTSTGWQWLPDGGPANASYNQTQNAIIGVPPQNRVQSPRRPRTIYGQGRELNQPVTLDTLNRAYQRFLGRNATEADLAAHAGNPYGWPGIMQAIRTSPEARAFRMQRPFRPGPSSDWNNPNEPFAPYDFTAGWPRY